MIRFIPSALLTAERDDNHHLTHREDVPQKLRIRKIKMAKVSGLITEAAERRPSSSCIDLSDETQLHGLTGCRSGPSIEVHIPSSPFRVLPPPSPAPMTPLPSPPRATQYVGAPAGQHRRSESSPESSPEEPEIVTPKEEKARDAEVLKETRPETVQVYVDDEILADDILDFYQEAERR